MSESIVNGASRPLKLLALGDCNTSGSGNGQTIIDHAARRLKAAGFDAHASNWGHTMTTTREGMARLDDSRPETDVALLNYGLVDSWVTTIPRIYISYFPESRAKRLARKLLKSVKRRLRSPRISRWIPRGEVVPLTEYDRNLRRMIARLRQVNPSVTIVLWSTAHVLNGRDRNANIDRYNACLRTIAEETNCHFTETMKILGPGEYGAHFSDAVHLSNDSYRRIGVAISELILPSLMRSAASRERAAA